MSQALMPPRKARPISLTALIDVVFILLMFFMLTSSFTHWRAVTLDSKSASASAATDNKQPQLLVLHESGTVTLVQDEPQDYDSLSDAISAIRKNEALVLLPEPKVEVGTIVHAMEDLNHHQVESVTLGETLPEALDK